MLLLGLSSHLQVVRNDHHLRSGWSECSGVVLGLCRNVWLAGLSLCCYF